MPFRGGISPSNTEKELFRSQGRGLKIDSRACHDLLHTPASDNRAGIA
jgi:hypothetical protein